MATASMPRDRAPYLYQPGRSPKTTTHADRSRIWRAAPAGPTSAECGMRTAL